MLTVVALLAVCCVAYFIFSGGEKKTAEKKDKQTKRIKEVKPAAAPTNKVDVAKKTEEPEKGVRYTRDGRKIKVPRNPWGTPIPKDLEYKPHWEYTTEDYCRIDPGYKAKHERFLKRLAANPWKTTVDGRLATLLFTPLGMPSLSTPFRPEFKDQFLKSLQTPIIVSKDDSPELQEQKRQMIETKIWLKDQIDDGKDIVGILNEEWNRQQKAMGLRNNLQRELAEIRRTATSAEELQTFVDAANKMLEEQGAAKIPNVSKATKMLIDKRLQKESNQ